MPYKIGAFNSHKVDAALAMHKEVVRIYERTWNAHTFDFEEHVGRFMAPDISVVLLGAVDGRALLRDISHARADYVRNKQATVTISGTARSVTDLGTAIVVAAECDYSFRYPDQTSETQRVISSSAVRFLGGSWVFQHIHFGPAVRPMSDARGIFD
jgi:hypothetical protein